MIQLETGTPEDRSGPCRHTDRLVFKTCMLISIDFGNAVDWLRVGVCMWVQWSHFRWQRCRVDCFSSLLFYGFREYRPGCSVFLSHCSLAFWRVRARAYRSLRGNCRAEWSATLLAHHQSHCSPPCPVRPQKMPLFPSFLRTYSLTTWYCSFMHLYSSKMPSPRGRDRV